MSQPPNDHNPPDRPDRSTGTARAVRGNTVGSTAAAVEMRQDTDGTWKFRFYSD